MSLERISQPPRENHDAGELHEREEVAGLMLVARDETTESHHPREETLDVPPTTVPSKRPSILGLPFSGRRVRRDHLDAALLKRRVETVTVVRAVAYEAPRQLGEEGSVKGVEDELGLIALTARNPHGDRKTMTVCHCHDLGRLAASSSANFKAPLFAPA